MLQFKKQIAFLFGAIALISYVSIRYFPLQESGTTSVLAIQDDTAHMQVYLMDDNKTLVPLSIPVDNEMQEEDKLQMLIAYMSGKQHLEGFQALFKEECKLLSVDIENGIATLYFDDSFKQYDKENELRILEAITWGTTQFHDIEQVKINVNDAPIQAMPLANTPIPDVLNRSIGINHFETATMALHNSKEITVYCAKTINDTAYMVPQSRRISGGNDIVVDTVNALLADVSVSSELIQPLYRDAIMAENVLLEDGVLQVQLNKNILDSSQSVKQDLYDALVLSLCEIEHIEQIQVLVDGVVVSPSDEVQDSVSRYDLLYNEVKF